MRTLRLRTSSSRYADFGDRIESGGIVMVESKTVKREPDCGQRSERLSTVLWWKFKEQAARERVSAGQLLEKLVREYQERTGEESQ